MAKGRSLKEFYIFFQDAQNMFYTASYNNLGEPVINVSSQPQPLKSSPKDFLNFKPSFGTNETYKSGVRAVTTPFTFVEDAADILRYIDYQTKGYGSEFYLRIIRYNPDDDLFYLYFVGRFDFSTKKDNIINGYTINAVDYGIWGVLSQYDTVQYQIDCSASNPLAIPVMLDGITLRARFTYQPVVFGNKMNGTTFYFYDTYLLANTDGDSSGLITQSEDFRIITNIDDIFDNSSFNWLGQNFIIKTNRDFTVNIKGYRQFSYNNPSGQKTTLVFYWMKSTDTLINRELATFHYNTEGVFNSFYNFDLTVDLLAGESISFIGWQLQQFFGLDVGIYTPNLTNTLILSDTKADASLTYALRPLDLLQALVSKATNGKFSANSNFFAENNKLVVTCGNSIRNAPNAYISSSFQDWFKSYDSKYWLAFRILKGELWVEPFITVYDDGTTLFEIGEIKEIELTVDNQDQFSEIEVGSPKQDYRHPSGRLEFNSTNTFSVTQFNIKNRLSLISVYRTDGYGIEFIRLDYQQQSTKDNTGDTTPFMLDITDEQTTEGVEVENFVDFDVDTEPLAPIIHYPFNNDSVTSQSPTVRGICQPLTLVNIYVDGSLDGSTTSDSLGNWRYDILATLTPFVDGVSDGVHTIESTFTDLTGATDSRTVTIYSGAQPYVLLNPLNNANLYDNKPLISGLSPINSTIHVLLDGIDIGTTISDFSGRWFFQMPIMSNAAHTIQVGTAFSNISVNSFVSTPLITSFSDGFAINNNLPLVEGVALPGTKVDLYLDYYPDVSIGTAFSDANGNWSIQLIPLFKSDGTTVLTPIPEGNHIISTSLDIKSAVVSITGFKLNRPDYTDIEGVIDNTVFNTTLSPKLDLIARIRFFKSVFYQQPDTIIKFETGDKNQQFQRTIDGITIKENDNVFLNSYPDEALFLPIILRAIVETPFSFIETMDNFSSGGLIHGTYQGLDIYALPIGDMTVQDVDNNVQQWSLLLSYKTPLITLLKLTNPGVVFNVMQNSIFRSDYNSLHFVKYGFTKDNRYRNPEIYDDWFENRNDGFLNNPIYIQKFQQSDGIITDQIVTNSTSSPILNCYKCNDVFFMEFAYAVVSPSPINSPDVLWECPIDLSTFPDGQFFFVMYVGGVPVAISERIEVKAEHEMTILFEGTNNKNKPGIIFTSGFKSMLRLDGMVQKWQPNIETIIEEDEVGDFDNIHTVNTRKRIVDIYNTPDYLAIKASLIMTTDNCTVEGVGYVVDKSANFEPVDKVPGYPLYYYSIPVTQKENNEGITIPTQEGEFENSVVLSVDNTAFGLGGGGFTNITLENE